MVENSGIDEAWVESELYSNVTVHQIITGKYFSDNVSPATHTVILEAFVSVNMLDKIQTLYQKPDNNQHYKWVKIYIRQVMIFLQFLCATRQKDWLLHSTSLENILVCSLFLHLTDWIMHKLFLNTLLIFRHLKLSIQKRGKFYIMTNSE